MKTQAREKKRSRRRARLGCAVILISVWLSHGSGPTFAQTQQPAKPSARDKCPVCGMFVAGYQDFLAAVAFRDGSIFYFDGPKDMFRFFFDPAKYLPGRLRSDIGAVWVTDYYSLALIDGSTALFVRGSDILGPMGSELIPFGKEEEARGFMKDHKGEALLRFEEITPDVIKNLD